MTQSELIKKLIDGGMLKTERIIKAFSAVDRADFVRDEYRGEAYGDYPLPIGHGQTISQPSTVAFMLELLQPDEGDKILDVGSGSGWTTVLLAEITGPQGGVIGVELIPELVKFGQDNLFKYNFPWAKIEQGRKSRFAPPASQSERGEREAPNHTVRGEAEGFDKILTSASAQELPQELVDQLKPGGRLVLPIENSVWKIDKISEKEIKREEFPGFVFVPLK